MEIIPALDVLDGGVVRLHRGNYTAVTRYPVDPVAFAASARGRVARLHLVDLEGARSGRPTQLALLRDVCAAFGPGVQVGGGIRDLAAVEAALSHGASRVVLGTSAVRAPEAVREIVERHPGQVILAVDARDGLVAIEGWTQASTQTAVEVARRFDGLPLDALLYTDVSRDGTRSGPAVEATERLARDSGRPVIASGGVGSLDHLRALSSARGILGVVVGRALLDGVFELSQAIEAAGAAGAPGP